MIARLTIGIAMAICMSQVGAAGFPDKPVSLVIPYSPGGLTDQLGRTYADKLSDIWGQPVVVENRPGAGSSIGAGYVARSRPDGYTILLGSVGMVTNPMLFKSMPYKSQELKPLALLAVAPNVLYVHSSVPAQNVQELVAYAKAHPGKISFASSGVGSSPHLAAELFAAKTGIDVIQVPYKGTGAAISDFLGGQVNAYFDTMQSMRYTKDGTIRALAVTTEERIEEAPDIPTMKESGVDGVISGSWFGIFVRAETPEDVQQKILATLKQITQNKEVSSRIVELGLIPKFEGQDKFIDFIHNETDKWGDVIRTQHISIK